MSENRIHIFGASGSGVTSLGRALSDKLNIPCFDFDDYYWEVTDPPYTKRNDPHTRIKLLKKAIGDNKSYIISGHYGKYMSQFDENLTLAIFIYTPQNIRLQRLKDREFKDFGERVLEDGDMNDNLNTFLDWAAHYDTSDYTGRNLKSHIERILELDCPVLKFDGKKDTIALAQIVKEYLTNSKE